MASPEHESVAELVRAARDERAGSTASLVEQREAMEVAAAMLPPPDEDVRVEAVDAGGVPAEWVVAPAVDEGRVLLYMHGGAYTRGSLGTHRGLVGRLSDACRARAMSVDYRLAPEAPFPAAVDDAVAAYRWILASGADPASVVVGGDSAGGGLAVALLLALRDAGDPLPAGAVLLSPWVDLGMTGGSATTKAGVDPMIDVAGLHEAAAAYAGPAGVSASLVSPIHADLAGLPPLLVQVGTAEVLLDDAMTLAERARAAGVTVEVEAWDDLMHVFQVFAPLVPEAVEAIGHIGTWMRARTP